MTTGTNKPPTTNELLKQISDNTQAALRYARMRFLGTWLAVGLLALLTCIALLLASENAKTNLKQTNDIANVAHDTADEARAQSDQTVAYLRGEQGIPGVPGANGKDGTPGQPSSTPGPAGPTGKGARLEPLAQRERLAPRERLDHPAPRRRCPDRSVLPDRRDCPARREPKARQVPQARRVT